MKRHNAAAELDIHPSRAGFSRARNRPFPKRRSAYGRRPDSHDLVSDPLYHAWPASELGGPKRCYPMPGGHGGVRWVIRCPNCGAWRKELYSVQGCELRWCRRCWGLRYESERAGRRPEASPERLEALAESAFRARSPDVEQRRMERFEAAYAQWQAHELAFLRRFGANLDTELLARDADDMV